MCSKKKKNEDGSFWNDHVTISTETTRRYCFLTFFNVIVDIWRAKMDVSLDKNLAFRKSLFSREKKGLKMHV